MKCIKRTCVKRTCMHLGAWLCLCAWLLAASLVQAQTTAMGASTAVGVASPPPVRYSGAPMSLQLSDVDVREALAQVAQFTGLNLVVSDSVSGKLTLRVHQVPWDQVLDLIAQARGLHVRRQGRVVWIATRAEVAARDKAQLEEWQATQNLEPVQTRHFVLHYARALDVQMRLQGGGVSAVTSVASPHAARVLSARGAVVADPRTNQLFVTDVPERLNQVAHIVSHMDVPLRQVMIEARIVQANDSLAKAWACAWAKPRVRACPCPRASQWGSMVCGSTCRPAASLAQRPRVSRCRFFSPAKTICSIWSYRPLKPTAKARWYRARAW